MSHLPLDARAILEYLNELGYRNISADQLKEFMKGMQRQSEISSSSRSNKTQQKQTKGVSSNLQKQQQQQQKLSSTATTTSTTKARASSPKQKQSQQQRTPIKIIKSKKPLINFKFYLDICDHQVTKKIEEKIQKFGGTLEFFLTSSVTHFITDKNILPPSIGSSNNNNLSSRPGTPQTPYTPGTPGTPQTPYNQDLHNATTTTAATATTPSGSRKQTISSAPITRQSRADAILNRARRGSSVAIPTKSKDLPTTTTTINFECNSNQTYVVWQIEQALRFFAKIQIDLKDYLIGNTTGGATTGTTPATTRERKSHSSSKSSSSRAFGPTHLKGSFIKIESLKRNYRPYYQLFKKPLEWPKIELRREDGAFRLSPKKEIDYSEEEFNQKIRMTRKSRSRSTQRQEIQQQPQQQQQTPIPATVQNLKKTEIATTKSSGQKGNICKQTTTATTVATGAAAVKETSEKQCGVCEICKIEYDTLTIHLKTKDHEYFAKNSQNFIALDTLINSSADVNKFLKEEVELEATTKVNENETKQNMELEEMEVEEQDVNSDINTAHDPLEDSIDYQQQQQHNNKHYVNEDNDDDNNHHHHHTPSPTQLREKSKRITKGKHSSEKFQNTKSSKRTSSSATTLIKSPKLTVLNKTNSPNKKSTSSSTAATTINNIIPTDERISTRNKTAAAAAAAAATTTTTTSNASAVYSPPMRAMLPPSSMYKVVDATPAAATNAQLRKLQNAAGVGVTGGVGGVGGIQTPNSPSLIVKFKKVRETELCVLTGEADRFMFRKQRTSSELPTDLDRQTTSEPTRANNSSTSLESSSANETSLFMDLEECEKTENQIKAKNNNNNSSSKKAIAIAKRRKGTTTTAAKTTPTKTTPTKATTTISTPTQRQRFPNAPIQPEIQLKNLRNTRNATPECRELTFTAAAAATTTATTTISSRRATLPEATRKSSRTATAIVTAATTSSRLLRAAVEAAKKAGNDSLPKRAVEEIESPNKLTRHQQQQQQQRQQNQSRQLTVVKMEDRMGDIEVDNENTTNKFNTRMSRTAKQVALLLNADNLNNANYDDDDDEDEDLDVDDDDEDDTEKDEDFIINRRISLKHINVMPNIKQNINQNDIRTNTTREERAARRWTQRIETLDLMDIEIPKRVVNNHDGDANDVDDEPKYGKRRKLSIQTTPQKTTQISKRQQQRRLSKQLETTAKTPQKKSTPPTIKKVILASPPQRAYDITKSDKLPKMRYAFERLPITDLWYRVYTRQDACEEKYFEYYGSQQYRKLPYELGPIPFDYTLNDAAGKCCTLCQKAGRLHVKKENVNEQSQMAATTMAMTTPHNKIESETTKAETATTTLTRATTPTKSSYTHKHKKLHLLQRYQQEMLQEQQQQQQQPPQQQNNVIMPISKCDSKASTPDREREREQQRIVRAGSTHSNTSSCTASSTATINSKHKYHNKHLSKVNFLNLELPPRKSPREHASTLALVSCIIRQRQDSLSKTNSETDEPQSQSNQLQPITKAPESPIDVNLNSPILEEKPLTPLTTATFVIKPKLEPLEIKSTTPELLRSPRTTRSAAATPVEELRFATEISETVKRMRRGQNKYDHSPPIVLKTRRRPTRGKCKSNILTRTTLDRNSYKQQQQQRCSQNNTPIESVQELKQEEREQQQPGQQQQETLKQRRRPRSLLLSTATTTTTAATTTNIQNSNLGVRRKRFGRPPKFPKSTTTTIQQPSIRKTGSKKGVLEFEVDGSALRALKAVMAPQPNIRQLEWEIDKYLEVAANDLDNDDLPLELLSKAQVLPNEAATTTTAGVAAASATSSSKIQNPKITKKSPTKSIKNFGGINTPPPTDCFSSDFDLYDLFIRNSQEDESLKGGGAGGGGGNVGENEIPKNMKSTNFSIYSSAAVQNYFRKRKSLKSNRTGWPKAQKKKTIMKHQHVLRQKIRFLTTTTTTANNEEQSNDTMIEGDEAAEMSKVVEQHKNNVEVDNNAGDGEDIYNNGNDCDVGVNGDEDGDVGDGVITPPDSEIDDNATVMNAGDDFADDDNDEDDDDDDNAEYLDAIDDTENLETANGDEDDENDCEIEAEDAETIADSIEIERCFTADLEAEAVAAEADVEAEDDIDTEDDDAHDDDDDDEDDDTTTTTMYLAQRRNKCRRRLLRRSTEVISPILMKPLHHTAVSSLTSTPTTAMTTTVTAAAATTTSTTATANMLRGLRRTPNLLNGSLGSCISPSEKAGDNSDIFTVSSDGLDTDLDMSNSHNNTQYHQHQHNHSRTNNDNEQHDVHCPHHRTPKRKYDISKYAPNNKNPRTCAAEAATAAAKSLAISQFLKKEVRVTCRRLRPPFRRFRFRR